MNNTQTTIMEQNREEFEKRADFLSLSAGDIIICSDGKKYSFIKRCRINFRARNLDNDTVYSIPNTWFTSLVEKAVKTKKDTQWYSSLKKGDKFYIINNKRNCLLFLFEGMREGKILGKHIVDGTITSIYANCPGAKL